MEVEKRELYIIPAKRRVMINLKLWNLLAAYKVFFPPDTRVRLSTKNRPLYLSEIEPWPDPEQHMLDF